MSEHRSDAASSDDLTRPAAPGESHDQFGRRIEYLRISVTDRCNCRCR